VWKTQKGKHVKQRITAEKSYTWEDSKRIRIPAKASHVELTPKEKTHQNLDRTEENQSREAKSLRLRNKPRLFDSY